MTKRSREEWAAAYVIQANEDLRAARALQGRYSSVLAMLLQMVFEKLAKAALLYGKKVTVKTAQSSHRAAVSLMAIFRRHPDLLDLFPGQNQQRWVPTVAIVEQLTRLHPSLVESGPQLEYPWEDDDGIVVSPVNGLTPTLRSLWNSPEEELKRLTDLFTFARILSDNVEDVFK